MTLALTKWRPLSIQPNSFPRLVVTMVSALGLLFAFAYWQQGTKLLRRPNVHFASQLPFRNFPHSTDYTYRSADRSCLPVAERNQSSPGATMESRVGIIKARQIANGGYEKIQPGSGPVSFVGLFVMALSKLQHKRGLFGSVGELGVHHGRFTVVLYITARTTEKLVAVDIFMQQGKNQDGSGEGDLERFFAALKYVDIGKDDLDVLHIGGTTELPFDWHERQEFEPFRMVSVDAGHTAVLTYNDLEVSACSTMSGGIIILDDFFHPHWTGVTVSLAFCKFNFHFPSPHIRIISDHV